MTGGGRPREGGGGARSTGTACHRLHRTLRLSRHAAFRRPHLGIQRAPSNSGEGSAPSKWCATVSPIRLFERASSGIFATTQTSKQFARPTQLSRKLTHLWEMLASAVDLRNSYIVCFTASSIVGGGGGERRLLALMNVE